MSYQVLRCFGVSLVLLLGAAPMVTAQVAFPEGTQDWESMNVGESIFILDWVIVNGSVPAGQFTIVAADDPFPPPGLASSRWVRVTDIDGGDVQNRFYSPPVVAPTTLPYHWTFHVLLEATPPGGGSAKPRFTIQHFDGNGFSNAWGIEISDASTDLVVTGVGGTGASAALGGPLPLNTWVRLDLSVDFVQGTVSGSIDGGSSVSLPIALNADATALRFCYRGEGTGNVVNMLVDDVRVTFVHDFLRGDASGDGAFNPLVDSLFILNHGFLGGPAPICLEAADADGDGVYNALVEALFALMHGFTGGPPLPAPFPNCGPDPDPENTLGCQANGC